MIHDVIGGATIVISWVIAHKDTLLALAGGGAGLAVFAQGILHKLAPGLASLSPNKRKAYAYALVQALVFLASAAAYAMSNANIIMVYPWLATVAAVVHRFAINPIYVNKVLPFLEFQANVKSTSTASATVDTQSVAPAATSFVS